LDRPQVGSPGLALVVEWRKCRVIVESLASPQASQTLLSSFGSTAIEICDLPTLWPASEFPSASNGVGPSTMTPAVEPVLRSVNGCALVPQWSSRTTTMLALFNESGL
jgi:hypothetical protein